MMFFTRWKADALRRLKEQAINSRNEACRVASILESCGDLRSAAMLRDAMQPLMDRAMDAQHWLRQRGAVKKR